MIVGILMTSLVKIALRSNSLRSNECKLFTSLISAKRNRQNRGMGGSHADPNTAL